MSESIQNFLEKVVDDAWERAGVIALLGHGSYFKGRSDAYSDLDVIFVAEPSFIADVTENPQDLMKSYGDLIVCRSFQLGPDFSAVLSLFNPEVLRVDFGLRTRGGIKSLKERPTVLLDKTSGELSGEISEAEFRQQELDADEVEGKFWLLVEGATRRLLRGEYFETTYLLGFLRSAFLAPMISRRMGWLDMGFRWMELAPEPDYLRLTRTIAAPSFESCRSALLYAIDLYVDLRSDRLPVICLDDLECLVRRRLNDGLL